MARETVACRRCGKRGEPLAWPPLAGEAGATIVASICAGCWSGWLEVQTRLINEHRLSLLQPAHRSLITEQCLIWLGLAEGEAMALPGASVGEEDGA